MMRYVLFFVSFTHTNSCFEINIDEFLVEMPTHLGKIDGKFQFFAQIVFLTLKSPSFWQIGMAGGGRFCLLCNFCLNGPIDLKFGMWIVLGNISRYEEKSSN